MPLPGQGLLARRGGGGLEGGLEQPPLRGRLRYIGPDDAEAGIGEQVPDQHRLATAVRADEMDHLPGQGDQPAPATPAR
ncbi:hypothetical protein [Streptomyces cyaneofuscatus]|uniref:hypothetical protein n=1 Tax=Streptomyces cyaneofuscatus TaxID=66883 RepID=UPI0037AE12FE